MNRTVGERRKVGRNRNFALVSVEAVRAAADLLTRLAKEEARAPAFRRVSDAVALATALQDVPTHRLNNPMALIVLRILVWSTC